MTLPIVERELRVASRQRRTYWERLAGGGLSIVVVLFVLNETFGRAGQAHQGRNIFYTISAFAFFYALAAGIILTADSVSEEKREGTLGLLFLTNLKGYDVILGKLTYRSLHAAYGMITIFPIMAIAFLMGGVRGDEMGRMVLMLLNTLFFSLALGMLISTASRSEMRARIAAFILLTLISLALPMLADAFDREFPFLAKWVFKLSPVDGWSSGFSETPIQNLQAFWINQAAVHAMGWTFLLAASFMISRVWQDKAAGGAFIPFRQKIKNWRFGNPEVQKAYRTKLLEVNPITWLANRNPLTKWYPGIFLAGCLALYGLGYLEWGAEILEEDVVMMFGLVMHSIFKWWAITDSVRLFSESKKSGALDLIVTTPMRIPEIVFGYWNGLVYHFRWGTAALLCADLALIALSENNEAEWVFVCFVGMILLVFDLMTIGWLGMWLSLSRKSVNAVLSTAFHILVLPWLIFFVLVIGGRNIRFDFAEIVLTFLTVCLLIDFLFYQWSSVSLKNEFRRLVANQFRGNAKKGR